MGFFNVRFVIVVFVNFVFVNVGFIIAVFGNVGFIIVGYLNFRFFIAVFVIQVERNCGQLGGTCGEASLAPQAHRNTVNTL